MGEHPAARLGGLLRAFAEDPIRTAKSLREMVLQDEAAALRAAVAVLDDERGGRGARYVLGLVANHGTILRTLVDPRRYSLAEAVRMANALSKIDNRFLNSLASVSAWPDAPPEVRERAMLITDSRQRADRVETMWERDTPTTQQVFEQLSMDPHHRVRANALVGLYRRGDPRGIAGFFEMSESTDAMYRAAAAWGMKVTGDPRFISLLERMAAEPGRPGLNARKALEELRTTLEEMTAREPWRVEPILTSQEGRTHVRLVFSLAGPEGKPVAGLPATSFVLTDRGQPVWRFSGREVKEGPTTGALYELRFPRDPSRDAAEAIGLRIYRSEGWAEAELPLVDPGPFEEKPSAETSAGPAAEAPPAASESPAKSAA